MTPSDVNPLLPVEALLLGGPAHNKRINLTQRAKLEGYTVTESRMHATKLGGSQGHVETSMPHHETLYVFWRTLGGVDVFVAKPLIEPDAYMLREWLTSAQENWQAALEKQQALYREKLDAEKATQASEEYVAEVESQRDRAYATLARIHKRVGAVRIIVDDIASDSG